ncbi:MAG: hypothetical protein ACFHWZ_04455 [Phycisphaerales bacterium]
MEADPLHQSIEVVEIVKLDLKRSRLAVFGTDANTRPEVLADALGKILDRRGDLGFALTALFGRW